MGTYGLVGIRAYGNLVLLHKMKALITLDLIKFEHRGMEISQPDIYVTKRVDNSAIAYSNPSRVAIIMGFLGFFFSSREIFLEHQRLKLWHIFCKKK